MGPTDDAAPEPTYGLGLASAGPFVYAPRRMSFGGVKIVSGGQTGADRAALDFALAQGLPHGGWCPKGRLAEDGPLAPRYQLTETPSADYDQRTEWNVRDSDGTVVFSLAAELTGGCRTTAELAQQLRKPLLHLSQQGGPSSPERALLDFVRAHRIQVLNVAGPRASLEPAVGAFVTQTLRQTWGLAGSQAPKSGARHATGVDGAAERPGPSAR
jgi:hypothetical protein